MSLNPLNNHYAIENPASVYDEEAMTALELAGRTASKVNETVEAFNNLKAHTAQSLNDQDQDIEHRFDDQNRYIAQLVPETVTAEVERKIESGEFDESINTFLGDLTGDVDNLTGRLNNLLGTVTTGTTTMDAEVIDGRRGEDGTTYANLGEAIRSQFGKTLRVKTADVTDPDLLTTVGIYTKGGTTWANVPEDIGGNPGVIVTLADPLYTGRKVQLIISHSGHFYFRGYNPSTSLFTEWIKVATSNNVVSLLGNKAMVVDNYESYSDISADDIVETGAHFFGSDHKLTGAPSKLGLLIVYKGRADYNRYQMWFDYSSHALYTRSYKYQEGYSNWVKVMVQNSATDGKVYAVQKVNDNLFYITKNGTNGSIRYEYEHDVDSNINLNTYRLRSIVHIDNNGASTIISEDGADLEGVVLLNGEADHVGGVHGDEQATSYYIFIDGKQYTMGNIPTTGCNEVRIVVESNITHADTLNVCMKKVKQTTFDRDGVHVNCSWEALKTLAITSVRGCMFSIQKDNFTHYYDSNVNRVPTATPAGTTASNISLDKTITDMIYVGKVSGHHWAGDRGGDASKYSTIIQDYGFRLKSYFNCYDNHTAQIGEKMTSVNHFNLVC